MRDLAPIIPWFPCGFRFFSPSCRHGVLPVVYHGGMSDDEYASLMLKTKLFLAFAVRTGSMERIAPGFSIMGAHYKPSVGNLGDLFSEMERSTGPWPASLVIVDVVRSGDALIRFVNMSPYAPQGEVKADEVNTLSDLRGLVKAIGQSRLLSHAGMTWRFDYLGDVPMPEVTIRTA